MPPKKHPTNSTEKTFSWTDEEVALLMRIVIDYKASKSEKGLDWETVKNKYEEIAARFQEAYPDKENCSVDEFPNCDDPTVINKNRICPKLKRIKSNYRKAVDCGRKSGGGRVVMALYDECAEVWAGSPAVDSILDGIETTTLLGEVTTPDKENAENVADEDRSFSSINTLDNEPILSNEEDADGNSSQLKIKDMGAVRRNLIKNLQEKKDSKLSKRLSTDAKLLDIAAQEVALKKRALEKMEEGDRKHEENMKTFADSMKSLTNVISSGFTMLQGMLNPNPIQNHVFQNMGFHPQTNNNIGSQSQEYSSETFSFKGYLDNDNY